MIALMPQVARLIQSFLFGAGSPLSTRASLLAVAGLGRALSPLLGNGIVMLWLKRLVGLDFVVLAARVALDALR
jgi:hypothetical protein